MTTTKVVETSVYINTNSPSQDSTNLDNLHPQTCYDTPGFKPFTLSFYTFALLSNPVYGIEDVVIGMAHRGKLELLVCILDYSPVKVFSKVSVMLTMTSAQ